MERDLPGVRAIFDEVMQADPESRQTLLKDRCDGDIELHSRVQALVAAADSDDSFLASPTRAGSLKTADSALAFARITEGPGTHIGPYKLLQLIGEGGFGSVFMADQEHPMRRRIALKIIKLGMDTRRVIARFEAERQALAMMDHPNIARVLDAGTTETGRPYFVMELVRGVPITEYCDSNNLTTTDRLELFIPVCRAVQHAHQKGVIHRDIKPSNILVTLHDGKPVPKVIDFGIAKATDHHLTEKTLFTEFKAMIGTPEYMSPEQAEMSGLDIDTRTDVYSLGVLLYELLTGTTPVDAEQLRSAGYAEMQRMIRELEPQKPSTRLSTMGEAMSSVAAKRRTEPKRLGTLLRGDLDWIVMMSLEKDRTRRYETASALAADVHRHLVGEPVIAAPPSHLYRLSKTLRRHRTATVVATVLFLVIAGALVATSVLWQQSARARAAESNQYARAEAINTFLKEMLTAADPAKAKGENLTVRESLASAARRIDDGALKDQPLVEAEVRSTIGSTYHGLGMYSQAAAQLRVADALYTHTLSPGNPLTLRTRSKLAEALSWMTDYSKAVPLAESTLAAQRRTLGAEHPDTQQTMLILGQLLPWADSSRFAEAELLLQTVLEHRKKTFGPEHIETARAMHLLGEAYTIGAYREKAEPLHREALRIHTRVLGSEHPETLETEYSLACELVQAVRSTEAEPILRRLLETRRRIQGPDHLGTLGAMEMLGAALNAQQRYPEAEPLLREKLTALQRTVGPDHQDNVSTRLNLAWCLQGQSRHAEAEAVLREALDVSLRCFGPEHADTSIRVMHALARSLEVQGKDSEAERVARQVIEIQRRQKSRPQVWELSKSIGALIGILKRRGGLDEAVRLEQELIGFALAAARAPDASPQNLNDAARRLLFTEFPALRDVPLAIELATEANRRTDFRNPSFLFMLAQCHVYSGDSAQAKEVWNQAFALLTDERARSARLNAAAWWLLALPPDEPRNLHLALEFSLQANELTGNANPAYLDTLALAYHQTGDTSKAIELQRKALSLLAANAPDRAQYEEKLVEFERAVSPQLDDSDR